MNAADAAPRYALYWAPAQDSALWRAGASWLGRDPAGAAIGPRPEVPADLVRAPASYGFHATLKPPMRLRAGAGGDDVLGEAETLAASAPAFTLPRLQVALMDGFLCLRTAEESAQLQALCDLFVAGLDGLRAPPDQDELARRRAAGLDRIAEANLVRWGYPQVFAGWVFHMTLSRRLTAEESAPLLGLARAWFAAALAAPERCADVCVFRQAAPGQDFLLSARVPLAPPTRRPFPRAGIRARGPLHA